MIIKMMKCGCKGQTYGILRRACQSVLPRKTFETERLRGGAGLLIILDKPAALGSDSWGNRTSGNFALGPAYP